MEWKNNVIISKIVFEHNAHIEFENAYFIHWMVYPTVTEKSPPYFVPCLEPQKINPHFYSGICVLKKLNGLVKLDYEVLNLPNEILKIIDLYRCDYKVENEWSRYIDWIVTLNSYKEFEIFIKEQMVYDGIIKKEEHN